MPREADSHTAWSARVRAAGVRLDLFGEPGDEEFGVLGDSIMFAAWESTLSDADLYPLLVRFWTGDPPAVDWPPKAPAVARRCAHALATRGSCELDTYLYGPTGASLKAALDAVVADLGLTPGDLLAALADHWPQLESLEMPLNIECTLLAFARHALLDPVAGPCALLWSTLNAESGTASRVEPMGWEHWSPLGGDDWSEVVAAELARLGRPVVGVPSDEDEAGELLASARATVLQLHGGRGLVAESIIRTLGWPGGTDLIDGLAASAVDLGLRHIDEVNAQKDNEDIVDVIQGRLIPQDDELREWIRDPAFGTLRDDAGAACTGAEMLEEAAGWLTWSLARASVEVVRAVRGEFV